MSNLWTESFFYDITRKIYDYLVSKDGACRATASD